MKKTCNEAAERLFQKLKAHPMTYRLFPLLGCGTTVTDDGEEAIYLIISSEKLQTIIPDEFMGYQVVTRVAKIG